MTKIENKQKIDLIIMKPIAYTKCAIGQDWYKNSLEITFCPNNCYPDYMEVNEWVMKEIDGKELNIEDVVDLVYNYIKNEYDPLDLTVRNDIAGCKTHFDVVVIRE